MASVPPTTTRRTAWLAAGVCAVAGGAVFQFFGNATRGYIDTASTFWWWVSQWMSPGAELEHGWLILGISIWLLWRNLRIAECGMRVGESVGAKRNPDLWRVLEGRSPIPRDEGVAAPGADTGGAGESAIHNPQSAIPRDGHAAACLAMIGALALNAMGFVAQQTRFSIVALLLFTWGVLRLGGGRAWGRAAVFPLGFMLFALPVNVLDTVGFWLRLWVVDAAGWFAHLVGIEVVRSGTQLFAPDGRYQYDVAAACSGVRSLMALAALSLLVGYVSFRSPWRRLLMLGLCFPLTYVGNVVRIGAVIVAAQAGGQRWGERTHDVMGIAVFAIVLGGVLLAARLLERLLPDRPGAPDGPASCGERRTSGASVWTFGWSVAVVALAVAEMFFLARVAERPGDGLSGIRLAQDGRTPADLPAFLGTDWIGQREEVTAVERAVLPADTGFARRNYVFVPQPAHHVFLSIVLSGRDRTSIHRPEICLVGQGWTITDRGRHVFDTAPLRIPATVLRTRLTEPGTGRERRALVAYWFVGADAIVATHWERILRDAWNRLRRGRADRWAYVLVQTDAADGESAALARMQTVLGATVPEFVAANR